MLSYQIRQDIDSFEIKVYIFQNIKRQQTFNVMGGKGESFP